MTFEQCQYCNRAAWQWDMCRECIESEEAEARANPMPTRAEDEEMARGLTAPEDWWPL